MKFSKIFLFFTLSFLVLFSACKEEEISTKVVTEDPIEVATVKDNPLVYNLQANVQPNSEGLDLGCFSVDFPFVLDVAGVEVSISNEEDFEMVLQDSVEYIDFVYPLNITYSDGEVAVIENGEELGEAFASCIPDGGWDNEEGDFPAYLICELNSCYQLVYPVNLVDSDGNTYIATTEEEFIDLISENFDLLFEFPISLLDEDGMTVTAEDNEALFELLSSCNEIIWPNDTIDWPNDTTTWTGGGIATFGCYEFGFPLTLLDEDGNTVVVNNEEEFLLALIEDGYVGFGFPLTLIDEDGNTIVVNNESELEQAFMDCGYVDIVLPVISLFESASNNVFGEGDCYEVLYPVDISDGTGTSVTLTSDAEAESYVLSGNWYLDFPVTLILNDGASTQLVVEDGGMLFGVWADCQLIFLVTNKTK